MKNICIIVGLLQGGGAERCAADLSVIFSNKGYNVYIITDLSYDVKYEYQGRLINYEFFIPQVCEDMNETPLESKVNELIKIKREYEIDISISFMQFANYLNILSKGHDKVILTTHSLNSEYAKIDKSVFWADKTFNELYQFADMITFPSEYCKNDWIEHWGDKNNITKTVYNPVHLMESCSKSNKENVVISMGRMHAIKRQWHLIRAFRRVKDLSPDSKLILLGDGELRWQLESLVHELNLDDSVDMPGNVPNVGDYLQRSKVFALTSRCEAMPCSVLESLSAGVPVVAFDIPGGIREELGISESKDKILYPIVGECGIITQYPDDIQTDSILSYEEEMLANEISRLLHDDILRLKLSENAMDYVVKFNPEKISQIWMDEILTDNVHNVIDEQYFRTVREYQFRAAKDDNKKYDNMYVSYYRLLEKWMILKENNVSTSEYFINNRMLNIIIYGNGKMARHLIDDLRNTEVNIVCIIDKSAKNMYNGNFTIIDEYSEIPKADCIVVTPVYQFDMINQELSKRTFNRIVSLDEVVGKLMIRGNRI